MKRLALLSIALFTIVILGYQGITKTNLNWAMSRGDVIAEFNGVSVFFNGGVGQVSGRNLSDTQYNIGLNWQCVEFIKRYYLEVYHHEMVDSYGHAKSFFNKKLQDGELNPARGLLQFANGGQQSPEIGDIIVLGPNLLNRFGHVGIISKVRETEIEYIGQNHGPFSDPYRSIARVGSQLKGKHVLGWLRKAQ